MMPASGFFKRILLEKRIVPRIVITLRYQATHQLATAPTLGAAVLATTVHLLMGALVLAVWEYRVGIRLKPRFFCLSSTDPYKKQNGHGIGVCLL